MFEIVSVFTRPDTEVDFFCIVHGGHPLVQEILKKYHQSPGSKGVSVKYQDRHKLEMSMSFELADDFWIFVKNNNEIINQRQKMINEWCTMTGHSYSFYTIDS